MEKNNLIAKRPQQITAVMLRREMAKSPAVLATLDNVERAVLMASSAKTVNEYTAPELAAELSKALTWISKDVGYIIKGDSDRQYLVIRTAEILKRYYPTFTMKDFRMAFEMSLSGELDDFLPKGRDGMPDKGHYQQFNAEYICKILNAYKARRAWILEKATDAMPKRERPRDPEMERFYMNEAKKECIDAYLFFKYHGRLPQLSPIGEMICYNILSDAGLADEIEVTLQEQREILRRTINAFIQTGRAYDANRLREDGTDSKELEHGSFSLARHKALARTFRWMAQEEVQITDYVQYT